MTQSLAVNPLVVVPLVVAGVVSGWTALAAYRRYESDSNAVYDDLARPYLGLVLVFSAGAFGAPLFLWLIPAEVIGTFPLLLLSTLMPVWTVFALRYTGRGHLVRWWWVAAGYAAVAALFGTVVLQAGNVLEESGQTLLVVSFLTSLLLLGLLAVYFVAIGLTLLSAYRDGSRSLTDAAVVILPTAILVVIGQVAGQLGPQLSVAVVVVGMTVTAPLFPLSVTRYDVLSTRPGVSTLGKRAVLDTMQAAVLVANRQGTVVSANETARRLFDDPVDTPLDSLVGADIETLTDADTVECWTTEGNRRLDPRVTAIESDGGNHIGETVTLIDVTDREIRRQRIQVLNRILRHNLRNELSAIKARAELATDDDQPTDEHVASVLSIADDLQAMSADARRIQKRISDDGQSCVTVDTVVESVVTAVEESHRPFDIDVDVPAATVSLDRDLLAYALRNLIENAVEHNDGDPRVEIRGRETATGIELAVADDGPGIPATEREAIEAGVEDAHTHTTSLGLWGTNWAVQTLGGTLTFGESGMGGAAVTLELPTDDSDGAASP